jgi:hypothetical protein
MSDAAALAPLPDEPDESPYDSVEAPPAPLNDADAEWALRRLRHARRKIAENTATHAQLIEETDAWLDDINAPLLKTQAELERQLANYMLAAIAADPNGPKSKKLPSGTIKSAKGGLSMVVDDAETFTAWAVKRGYVKPPKPPEPDTATVKDFVSKSNKDGFEEPGTYQATVFEPDLGKAVVVPGVTMVRKDRTVEVQVNL